LSKIKSDWWFLFYNYVRGANPAQQSVHPTLGILARFQAFFYALSFFQSDGVPPPALVVEPVETQRG
jgi:hypothetical protein